MNRYKAFILGLLEFRQSFTTNCGDYSYEYDNGRDFAHFLTFRVFDAWQPIAIRYHYNIPGLNLWQQAGTYNRTLKRVNMTEPATKKKQDFSAYRQFPVRLNINKCLDIERIAKIAEMQSRGISFVDFVRNALDKYETGGKL